MELRNESTVNWVLFSDQVLLNTSLVPRKQEETDLNFSLFGRGDLSLDILAPKSFEIHGIQGFHKYHLQAFNKVVGDNLHNSHTWDELCTRNV